MERPLEWASPIRALEESTERYSVTIINAPYMTLPVAQLHASQF